MHWLTPYEMFHTFLARRDGIIANDRKPQQTHLRAYGCKAFSMTKTAQEKEMRLQNLNPNAWIGYLVGYNSTNIYRIWNPVTGQTLAMRDVIFNEDERYFWQP